MSSRRAWFLGLCVACLAIATQASPPVSEGEFRISSVALFNSDGVEVRGLPVRGRLDGVVSIAHIDVKNVVFGGAAITLHNREGRIVIRIEKEDHGLWPVTAVFYRVGQEPESLELHLVGLTPAQARRLQISWGPDRAPRILFGDHQEVEFGKTGFVPTTLVLESFAGAITLDPVQIRSEPAP